MNRVVIEKLVFGGQGLGRSGSKVVFVWGALPGEEVEYRVTKSKKNFVEGVMTQVVTPAPGRIDPREDHYLSCSPWQTLSFVEENKWKTEMARETYQRLAGIAVPSEYAIVTDGIEWEYRNKIEYSFADDASGQPVFAFHERGQYWQVKQFEQCDLATTAINATAKKVLAWIQKNKWKSALLKNLVVRSNRQGETIAALFINEKSVVPELPSRDERWRGFAVYYSYPLTPAAVPTALLAEDGENFLVETIDGVTLRYGLNSFFQVNVSMFERAVADIQKYIPTGSTVIDYYAGVGSIGLALGERASKLVIVESNAEAVGYAEENVKQNRRTNAEVKLVASEQATDLVTTGATVIVDPPRAGLDKKFIAAVLERQPERLVYLSCDLATQARDLKALESCFKPIFFGVYNFFPRTPHIEGLVVLDRIGQLPK